MSASTYGLSGLTFGVPTKSGYVVQAFTHSATPALVVEIQDETGVRKHVRYDDQTEEITVEAIIQGATLPTPGGTFVYDGTTYEILSVEKKGSNKDFVRVSIKGKKSEGVSLS
jgi:hypothetical protein